MTRRSRPRLRPLAAASALALLAGVGAGAGSLLAEPCPWPGAAVGLCLAWSSGYDGPGHSFDEAFEAALAPDGATLFLTGQSTGAGGHLDFATAAHAVGDGAVRWVARFDSGREEAASQLALAADGGAVFVTGWNAGTQLLVAHDTLDGSVRWTAALDGLPSDLAAAGGLVVAAGSDLLTGDGFLTAFDATTGARVWEGVLPFQAETRAITPAALAVGGGEVVLAAREDTLSDGNFLAASYDLADGTLRWVGRDPAGAGGGPVAVARSAEGGQVLLAGFCACGIGQDFQTVAFGGADGQRLWSTRLDGPFSGLDAAVALALAPDGSAVVVAGRSQTGPVNFEALTVAYDPASGGERWRARFDGLDAFDVEPRGLAFAADGSMLALTTAAGPSNGFLGCGLQPLGSDTATVLLDAANGRRLATALHGTLELGTSAPRAVTFTPDGARVLVVGAAASLASGQGCDYRTLAYDLVIP